MPENLSADRWRRLDELFQAAIDLPDDDAREQFIERDTTGDAELRREIREMLAHAGGAADRIARNIESVSQQVAFGDCIGRRVGPYRLVREIGRGGMGIVFEAWRDDAEYHKTVALKLAPEWRDLDGLRERFRHERQILAGLEHPNIARFLDGGAEAGVPYFAMEFVEGSPITVWCRQHASGLRQRIELFRQVCAAVHYAHERLVVHRDLKPANILVDRTGVPKLLDFGIAKLLTPLPNDDTATAAPLWTPDYASPEQVRGEAATTRTDVYSLGLLLYELLCGERAQTPDKSSPLALDRSICETVPPLPSARGDSALSRQLRGDLDTIVAKAINKDPAQRYDSVASLSDDLARYLTGRPVEARPASASYRARKWIMRHRLAVAAGALLTTSIVVGAAISFHEARRAERRFQQVRTLANTFVFDVHDRIQNLPGATEARKAIVATALRYLENLKQEAGNDTPLLLELAAAYERIGDVQGQPTRSNLGETQAALASYRAAESILNPLYVRGDPLSQAPRISVEYKIGMLHRTLGQQEPAAARYENARQMVRSLIAKRPKDTQALKLAGDILVETAHFRAGQRDYARARQAAQEAMDVAQNLIALDPSSLEARDYLSQAYSSLGLAFVAERRQDLALPNFRAVAKIREQLVEEHPNDAEYRRNQMIAYGHIADALGPPISAGLGDVSGAVDALRKASVIAEWLCQRDPADRKARFDLANVKYRAGGVLLLDRSQSAQALALLEAAQGIVSGLQVEDPSNQRYRYTLLYGEYKIGKALAALGRNIEAAKRFSRVRSKAPGFRGTTTEAATQGMARLATLALARIEAEAGDPRAPALADAFAAEMEKPVAGNEWSTASSYGELGAAYLRMAKWDQATLWLEKSAQAWRVMIIPPPLEAKRRKELEVVEAGLERAHKRIPARPGTY